MRCASALALMCLAAVAGAQEAAIRQALGQRLPQLKVIDEIKPSGVGGLFEVRVNGSEIYYTDAKGDFLIDGQIIDTKTRRNLTEERIAKLTAIPFDSLPIKDAFTLVRGNGQRKMAVFEDPNCGYCKRFERDLQKVDNVTVYLFLYPVLGPDSLKKSHDIWCAKDRAVAWQDWMLRDQPAAPASAMCDTAAVARNVELGRKYKITGTPTLLFVNGLRIPGAVDNARVEQALADTAKL
ncbi:MAG: DsbC family protein [Betaproteobacteria bacterium]|nr:DsbC family protein [Betaproteobacteria bacterium]